MSKMDDKRREVLRVFITKGGGALSGSVTSIEAQLMFDFLVEKGVMVKHGDSYEMKPGVPKPTFEDLLKLLDEEDTD